MADDIVNRLRCNPCDCDGTCWTCLAADEIERLQSERIGLLMETVHLRNVIRSVIQRLDSELVEARRG